MIALLRILRPEQFVSCAWKNGGGITHEIARHEVDGQWAWRLSLAEVASDGPFSHFEGLSRILTVIEGNGIDLHTPGGVIPARLLQPICFSGDMPVNSQMVAGPIRDLNVIYNARQITAHVEVMHGPCHAETVGQTTGFLSLAGCVTVSGQTVPVGACALGTLGEIVLADGATGVAVFLLSPDIHPAGQEQDQGR